MILTEIPIKENDKRNAVELESELKYDFMRFKDYDGEPRDFKYTEYPLATSNGTHDDNGNLCMFLYGHGNDLLSKKSSGFEIDEIMFDRRLRESGELKNVWLPCFETEVFDIHEGFETDVNGNDIFIHNVYMTHHVYDYIWFKWDGDSEELNDVIDGYTRIEINDEKYFIKWQTGYKGLE